MAGRAGEHHKGWRAGGRACVLQEEMAAELQGEPLSMAEDAAVLLATLSGTPDAIAVAMQSPLLRLGVKRCLRIALSTPVDCSLRAAQSLFDDLYYRVIAQRICGTLANDERTRARVYALIRFACGSDPIGNIKENSVDSDFAAKDSAWSRVHMEADILRGGQDDDDKNRFVSAVLLRISDDRLAIR